MSAGRIELGLVPWGAFGIVAFSVFLFFTPEDFIDGNGFDWRFASHTARCTSGAAIGEWELGLGGTDILIRNDLIDILKTWYDRFPNSRLEGPQ